MSLTIRMLVLSAWTTCIYAGAVYDSIPFPLPPNVPSVGYEANSIAELGNAVTLAPGSRHLTGVTVVMSNWAPESEYQIPGTTAGYQVPLTVNLYKETGALFTTQTIDAFIPWRPEHDPTCPGQGWLASDGNCYSGITAEVVFDFSNLAVTVPDTLIVGLAFNTQHYGYSPTGVSGPYNSLNFATSGSPSIGTNVYPNQIYFGTGGSLQLASGWSGYSPEFRIDVVPEVSSAWLAVAGLAAIAIRRRKLAACDRRSRSF